MVINSDLLRSAHLESGLEGAAAGPAADDDLFATPDSFLRRERAIKPVRVGVKMADAKIPHAKIAVTVDVIVGTECDEKLLVLLVRRGREPFKDLWALPGGFVEEEEDLPAAARRELAEEIGVKLPAEARLLQFRTYGRPGRDPRGRTVSIVHTVFVADAPRATGADDAAEARYWPVGELPEMTFDHAEIVSDFLSTLEALRTGNA